ncbi:MAG: nucleotide exchange factor GrpE [Caldilineales bacterium]|nr:nucleotide exchange factor GrpE [Caldilineales bacterium]
MTESNVTESAVNEAATLVEETLPAAASELAADRVAQLKAELDEAKAHLAQAKAKADEYLDGWQRARAELANYRRRTDAERASLTTTANARLLMRLLPVLDDLERAFETLPPDLRNLTWIQGVGQIYRKLQVVVEGEGATPIDAVGRPFDPKVHDAILQEASTQYPEGTVATEVQRGYMYGDQLLRPALVIVSSGPGLAADAEGGSPA